MVAKIAFIDKENARDCTRKKIEARWTALQAALGTRAKLPVERLHVDTESGRGTRLSNEEDPQLIRAVIAGDRRAFRPLVERYRVPIYGFILRRVRRPAIAEELLQETFLRAYRAAEGYQGRAAVSTWLFRIANNLCLNEAASARFRHEAIGEAPERTDPGASPADQLERAEVGVAVEAALASLPPQQRAAVQLARFEGFSYAEIAEVLGVSAGAVDGLLQRARQALRKQLQHLR